MAELDRRRVPYVCVNERVGQPVACVLSDDAMGMARAVEHRHRLDHRTVGYANARATYFNHYRVTERSQTLLAEARRWGVRVADGHAAPFCSPADFLRSAVVDGGATAVITHDHQIAIALAGAAVTMGISIPGHLSLICFNDVFPVAIMAPR